MDRIRNCYIKKAHRLSRQIEKLCNEIGQLLEPLCSEAMARDNSKEIKELLEALPIGFTCSFYRSELKTYLAMKKQWEDREKK